MCIKLNSKKIQEYKALHSLVWPSVLERIKQSHIKNYSIFLREPENILFGYLEYNGDDFQADMALMAADPETQRWWSFTDPCQVPLKSAAKGQWWAPLEEVFHVD